MNQSYRGWSYTPALTLTLQTVKNKLDSLHFATIETIKMKIRLILCTRENLTKLFYWMVLCCKTVRSHASYSVVTFADKLSYNHSSQSVHIVLINVQNCRATQVSFQSAYVRRATCLRNPPSKQYYTVCTFLSTNDFQIGCNSVTFRLKIQEFGD